MYNIVCLLQGRSDPFPVNIDETQTVGHLKKEIRKENSEALAAVDAVELKLYYINITSDEPNKQNYTKQVDNIFQNLSECKPLDPLNKLSKIEKGFPKGRVHIFVPLPPGESIHPRTCGAVAETMLSPSQPPILFAEDPLSRLSTSANAKPLLSNFGKWFKRLVWSWSAAPDARVSRP
jgi:hypothetical protein